MITAREARNNVINHEAKVYQAVAQKTKELIEIMGKSIEIHSENGIDHIDFTPFNKSRFPSYHELEIASQILEQMFKDNGYKVTRNSWSDNIFTVQW